MTEPALTPRLNMLQRLVPPCDCCCDIGADHGYLAIALSQKVKRVIAADVNRAPLAAAAENIRRFNAENVECRLSDGFSAINENEADCAVIAGMGGPLIERILSAGIKGTKKLILQPQSLIHNLRDYLCKNGFIIENEELCREDNRFYTAMLVRPNGAPYTLTEAEMRIGPVLLKKRPPLLNEYLCNERRKLRLAIQKIESSGTQAEAKQEYERLMRLYEGIEIPC